MRGWPGWPGHWAADGYAVFHILSEQVYQLLVGAPPTEAHSWIGYAESEERNMGWS